MSALEVLRGRPALPHRGLGGIEAAHAEAPDDLHGLGQAALGVQHVHGVRAHISTLRSQLNLLSLIKALMGAAEAAD